jgi:hypothetical protein
MSQQDDFETGAQETIDVTVRGVTRKYIVRDVNYQVGQKLFKTELDGEGNQITDPYHAARLIAASVLREDGSVISFEEACNFRLALVNQLIPKVMHFLSGTIEEDPEGKASSEETL